MGGALWALLLLLLLLLLLRCWGVVGAEPRCVREGYGCSDGGG